MKRDFTIQTYQNLLSAFSIRGYSVITVRGFLENQDEPSKTGQRVPGGRKGSAVSARQGQGSNELNKLLVLRHDIDANPMKAWEMAFYEHSLGIRSTYYFKIDKNIFNSTLIRRIADLGHEIGYHYEDLVKCRGNAHRAIERFSRNLNKFREIVPVVTICAEGSPLSRHDNRDLWKDYDYRDHGLIGEPYFDIDYSRFLYLTDTGRIWNGKRYNVRDKVESGFDYSYKSSFDIIRDLSVSGQHRPAGQAGSTGMKQVPNSKLTTQNSKLPGNIHLVVHPQRWHDEPLPWLKELVWQNVKNTGKGLLVKLRG